MRIHLFDTSRPPPTDPPSDRMTGGPSPPPDPSGPVLDVREVWARAGSAVRTGLPRILRLTASVARVEPRGHGGCDLELVPSHGVPGGSSPSLRAHIGVTSREAIAVALGRPFDPAELSGRDLTLTCTVNWLHDGRLRLSVTAIDPDWRASAIQLERARGLNALARADLLDAQRRLPQPVCLERVSILHPPGQGYEDVAATLAALEAAGLIQIDDLPCRFDGSGSAAEVVQRLDEAAALHRGREDRGLVLLVRGGGSPARALDAREVAGAIGTLSVPVAVAVGHRTDAPTLADLTAWRSLSTPSEARHLVLSLLEAAAEHAEGAWADLLAALGELQASVYRTGIARCEAVADEAEACLSAAERRAGAVSLALERGLERVLASLVPAHGSGVVSPEPPPVRPSPSDGLVRLTGPLGQPVPDAASAAGPMTLTFADGVSITVVRVELVDPANLH
ncbi:MULTISPECIES: exodeoxyribonuclease VII large subunit [Methylobacterium]|uniref:exodeoxyribonuclease VII large subunit n=1 Tax=Methylobacterium TaxID=407 RepID=UPI0036FE3E2E